MTRCVHDIHGLGRIRGEDGAALMVRFDDGRNLDLPADALTVLPEVDGVCSDRADHAIIRAQAVAIRSVQARWGSFSPARVRLLPHQLWVCQRVLAEWPKSWLIADDVGLGKTIEAGLILSALQSAGRLRRMLVIAPAGLVEQWQERLRTMFDIRSVVFSSETERSRTFWDDHDFVLASLQRLRIDKPGKAEATRWERLVDSDRPWDVVIVDEAHHLNADEQQGDTLGLRLLKRMQSLGRFRSLLLFTGTPHRGKMHGFQSLLGLVDPQIEAGSSWDTVRERLPRTMIRNNKQQCRDLSGAPLFQPVTVETRPFEYTTKEATFYRSIAEFVRRGLVHANGFSGTGRSQRTLLLIALLKIATSSAAAIKRSLRERARRLRREARAAAARAERLAEWSDPEGEAAEVEDGTLSLLADREQELAALDELVRIGDAIDRETRIEEVIQVARELPESETLLMFTEYKATQALLVSRLGEAFGPACVTFINGEGRLTGVKHGAGSEGVLEQDRETAAYGFNRGTFRFLVSTEAGGEGIDLHERCARLVHVDMPWNPMRMHQRVGRLNRIGQTRPVHVTLLRNDASLEGLILSKLYDKLDNIQAAFDAAMGDPEDIRSLVLGGVGGTGRALTEAIEAWASADGGAPGTFDRWFEDRLVSAAPTSGGQGEALVKLVGSLLGDVARFDFETHDQGIPDLSLSALEPFVATAARLAGAEVTRPQDHIIAFCTPTAWRQAPFAHFTLRTGTSPQWLIFDRDFKLERSPDRNQRLAGPGDRLLDVALAWAERLPDQCAAVPGLSRKLVLFVCLRAVSDESAIQRVLVGAEATEDNAWRPLQDWQVLERLNHFAPETPAPDASPATLAGDLSAAKACIMGALPGLGVSFPSPVVLPFACFVPAGGGEDAS